MPSDRTDEDREEDAEAIHDSGLPGPAIDGFVNVCAYECETCIFRKGNRMQLQSGRVRQMIDGSIADDTAITCHGTIYWDGSTELAVCRGFYDRHREDVFPLRLAHLCDRIKFITPPSPPDGMVYQRQESEDHE